MQTPQNLDKIGGDIVDIGFQHGFFAYFDERFLHFLGGLGDHFLDASGMNSSIGD